MSAASIAATSRPIRPVGTKTPRRRGMACRVSAPTVSGAEHGQRRHAPEAGDQEPADEEEGGPV